MEFHRDLPIDQYDVESLNIEIGSAVWLIQAVEDTLAHLITIVLKLPIKVAIEEADHILESTRKNTLGKLLRVTKESIELPDGFEKRVDLFLEERNWLIHRSWRLHHTDIYHPEKFEKLLLRIDSIGDEARFLNREFIDILEKFVISKDVKPESLIELANNTIDNWIKSENGQERGRRK